MYEKPALITNVEDSDGTWLIETKSSGFGFDKKYTEGKEPPRVGDEIICHTHLGSRVRGVTLRGELLFYKSDEELEADRLEFARKRREELEETFARDRLKLNEQYDALSPEFQRRVSWFRAHNASFRVEFEAYELCVCTDAALIAGTLGTIEKIDAFAKANWEEQQALVPGLYEGHSGNSFSAAIGLARLFIKDPLLVIAQHGALTPLVGCDEYGCAHPRPADVLAALDEETT